MRTDAEVRAQLQILIAAHGVCSDPALRRELLDTGFTRRDPVRDDRLHLTKEGRAFLHDAD